MQRNLKAYRKTVSIVNETSVAIFEALGNEKTGFLLESYDKNHDRYTIMGIEPEEIIRSEKNSIVIIKKDGTKEIREGNPLELLKKYYSDFHVTKEDGELAFTGGLVGCLGYDFVRYSEELPDNNPEEIGIETVQFMLATKFIVIDHVAETLTAVVLGEDTPDGRTLAVKEAEEMIEKVRKNIKPVKTGIEQDGKIIKK